MLALPAGPTCHTGTESCFDAAAPALPDLARTIAERAERGDGGSYVAGLLAEAREARQRKVGEEAVETVLAEPGSDHLVSEVADLWFHSMVLLAGRRPRSARAPRRARAQAPRSRCVSGIGNGRAERAFSLDTVWMLRYPWQAGTIRPAAQPFSGRKVA